MQDFRIEFNEFVWERLDISDRYLDMSQFGPEIPAPAIGLSLLPPGEYLPRKLLSQIYLICCQDLKSRVGELPASALYTLKTGIQLEIFSILFRYFR